MKNILTFFGKTFLKLPFLQSSIDKIKNIIFKSLPLFKKYKTLIITAVLAYCVVDLLMMKAYHLILPEKEISSRLTSFKNKSVNQQNKYKSLWDNNMFHTGEIPIKLADSEGSPFLKDPVLSSLSFALKGTIVHANPKRSVATLKNLKGDTLSYKLDDIIDSQAKVTGIERGRLIFFNQNNNRLEYVVLPKDDGFKISYQSKTKKQKVSKNSLIKRRGNNFEVNRSDINSHLEEITEILQQALVLPHHENGQMVGYRFEKIEEGSIYEDLGFSKGDIIKTVNGQSVKNPQKAMELYQSLKNDSQLKILVIRDGKEVELNYSVDENSPIN